MSIVSSDIYLYSVFPYLKKENKLRLNSIIKKEALDFSIIAQICKKLCDLTKEHLSVLKNGYDENIQALQCYKVKPPVPRIIHIALVNKDMQQFLTYLQNGADVNEKNRGGRTVLQLCKVFKRDEFAKIILSHPYLVR